MAHTSPLKETAIRLLNAALEIVEEEENNTLATLIREAIGLLAIAASQEPQEGGR